VLFGAFARQAVAASTKRIKRTDFAAHDERLLPQLGFAAVQLLHALGPRGALAQIHIRIRIRVRIIMTFEPVAVAAVLLLVVQFILLKRLVEPAVELARVHALQLVGIGVAARVYVILYGVVFQVVPRLSRQTGAHLEHLVQNFVRLGEKQEVLLVQPGLVGVRAHDGHLGFSHVCIRECGWQLEQVENVAQLIVADV